MPIRPYVDGRKFDDETVRVLGLAFEAVCIALRIGDSADDVRRAIAARVISLAENGERNPDILCELALKDIRTPPADWSLDEAYTHDPSTAAPGAPSTAP
jgi:hypothetical protein